MHLFHFHSCSVLLVVIARTSARATPFLAEDISRIEAEDHSSVIATLDGRSTLSEPQGSPLDSVLSREVLEPESEPYPPPYSGSDPYDPEFPVNFTDPNAGNVGIEKRKATDELQDSTSKLSPSRRELESYFLGSDSDGFLPLLDDPYDPYDPDPFLDNTNSDGGIGDINYLIADIGPQCQNSIYPAPLCCSIDANIAKTEYENEVDGCTESEFFLALNCPPSPRTLID